MDNSMTWFERIRPHLEAIEAQTVSNLGETRAHFFSEVANDWIAVNSAIQGKYSKEAKSASACYLMFQGLFNEVWWLQTFFVGGHYPLLCARLRFIWELMFRGKHADSYESESGTSVDDKFQWIKENERRLDWPQCMLPTLHRVLPLAQDKNEVENYYKSRWDQLNEIVHPSPALIYQLVSESALLVASRFDGVWAKRTIEIATDVFDLIWLAVFNRFPECAHGLREAASFARYPVTGRVLQTQ